MRKHASRRPHRAGRPITKPARDELVLPAYLGLQAMVHSPDRDAQYAGRHALAALLDIMFVALTDTRRDVAPIRAGLDAFLPIARRFDDGGPLRANGEQLRALRDAVDYADVMLGVLFSHHIVEAVAKVNAAIGAD